MKKHLWILSALLGLASLSYGVFGGFWIAYEEKSMAEEMTQQAESYQLNGDIAEATSKMDAAVFHGELANEFQTQGLIGLGGGVVLAGLSVLARKKLS